MEPVQAQIQEDVFGGFIGYSNSWEFMTVEKDFKLTSDISVYREKQNDFQSRVAPAGTRDIITIHLGSYIEYSLSQVIMLTEESKVSMDTIREWFIAAVDEAVESLENSETWKAWTLKHCSTYMEAIDCKKELETCNDNVVINAKDVKAFGKAFNERFCAKILALQQDCKTFTVTSDYTSRCSLGENKHFYLKIDMFSEVAIEFEHEYYSSDCALFWERDSVSKFMHTTPNEEYYPGMLNRLGNFGFIVNEKTEEGILIASVNFTGKLFSLVSRDASGAAFTEPIFAEYLAGAVTSQLRKNECKDWLIAFHRMVEGYTNRLNLNASYKVVMRMKDPMQETPQKMARQLKIMYKPEIKNQLKSYTMPIIKKHLEENLYPPYRTLEALYIKIAEKGQPITLDDIRVIGICESILCFALYGTMLDIKNEYMYSPYRCQFFKLLGTTFSSGPLFSGLRSLEHLRVVDGKIKVLFP